MKPIADAISDIIDSLERSKSRIEELDSTVVDPDLIFALAEAVGMIEEVESLLDEWTP